MRVPTGLWEAAGNAIARTALQPSAELGSQLSSADPIVRGDRRCEL
jgi:hypothetical protein